MKTTEVAQAAQSEVDQRASEAQREAIATLVGQRDALVTAAEGARQKLDGFDVAWDTQEILRAAIKLAKA